MRLASSALNANSSSVQLAKVQLRANSLRRKIEAWIKVHEVYIPAAAVIRARTEAAAVEGAEDVPVHCIPLLLPSALPPGTIVDIKFQNYEWRLRKAQGQDAIHAMRQHLRLQAHLVGFKFRFDRGQIQNLRSNDIISRVHGKILDSADRYRTARTALVILAPILQQVGWASAVPILKDTDIRQMTQGLVGESEGNKTPSWIWRTRGVGGDSDSVNAGVQDGKSPSLYHNMVLILACFVSYPYRMV